MKFTYDYSDGKEEITVHTEEQQLNQRTFEIIKERKDIFLPMRVKKEGKGYAFVCDMYGTINLKAWMAGATEREQNRMRDEIIKRQREIFDLGIREDNLLTQDRYMYVNEITQSIRFICIATGLEYESETDMQTEEENWELCEESMPELPIVPPMPNMDLTEGEEDLPEVKPLKDMPKIQEEVQYEEPIANEFEYTKPVENSEMEENSRTNWRKQEDDDSTRGFGFGIKDNEDRDEEKTVLLTQEKMEDEEKTVLLTETVPVVGKLIRCATEEEFILEKSTNIIGKSNTRADICIKNNPAVGNVHCRIIYVDGDFYLEDNQSLNGTYLKNEKLEQGQKILLESGNRIRLADEEFVFAIE